MRLKNAEIARMQTELERLESTNDPDELRRMGMEAVNEARPDSLHVTKVQKAASKGVTLDSAVSLVAAARRGYLETIRALVVQAGVDVNGADDSGLTALFVAAEEGHVDVIRVLVELGAHVRKRNERGDAALCGAAMHGHVDAVQALIDHGADVNLVNNKGFSVLYGAAQEGHAGVVKVRKESSPGVSLERRHDSLPAHVGRLTRSRLS